MYVDQKPILVPDCRSTLARSFMATFNVKEGTGTAEAVQLEEKTMMRTIFAMTIAGLISAAISGTSQAALIAQLPAGVTDVDPIAMTRARC
jgi:hypothetical protein